MLLLVSVTAPSVDAQVSAATSYGGQNVHGVQDWPLGAGVVARWYWSAPGHATVGDEFSVTCGGGIALGTATTDVLCAGVIQPTGCSETDEVELEGLFFTSQRWQLEMEGPVCTIFFRLLAENAILGELVQMPISVSITDPHYVNPLDVNVLTFPDTNVTLDGELDVAASITGDLVLAGTLEALLSGAIDTNVTGSITVDGVDINTNLGNVSLNATIDTTNQEALAQSLDYWLPILLWGLFMLWCWWNAMTLPGLVGFIGVVTSQFAAPPIAQVGVIFLALLAVGLEYLSRHLGGLSAIRQRFQGEQ